MSRVVKVKPLRVYIKSRGGKRRGVGRRRLLSPHQEIAVGGEFARLWRKRAVDDALKRHREAPTQRDIRDIVEQAAIPIRRSSGEMKSVALDTIPPKFRGLPKVQAAVAGVDVEVGELLELKQRGRYSPIPVKRPKGLRDQIIEKVISWCLWKFRVLISARHVETCIKAHRKAESIAKKVAAVTS